jgi:hypothetical protein
MDASSGGTFTSAKGTVISIPSTAFMDLNQNLVAGAVEVVFRDIYKKSEMLLSGMSTNTIYQRPLKSGGEFFIYVSQNGSPLLIAQGKKIRFRLPLITGPSDPGMLPFLFMQDSSRLNMAWGPDPADSLYVMASEYIFDLYQFSSPVSMGTWCNCDNPSFFSGYTQTVLTLRPSFNPSLYHPDVYLVFKNQNAMVHVYRMGDDFPYFYAPIGLECTLVAIGVENGKLLASFTPFTISANQVVPFPLAQMNLADFKARLDALN